jgi:hypothetical protein
VSTPFAAALSYVTEAGGVLVFDRSPIHVAGALQQVPELPDEELGDMQRAAWEAAGEATWGQVATAFIEKVIAPNVGA